MRRQLFSHIDTEVNAVAALRRDGLLRRESCTRIRAWVGNGRLHGSTLELSPRWECGGQADVNKLCNGRTPHVSIRDRGSWHPRA